MAKLRDYYDKKNLLQQLSDELEQLEQDSNLQQDLNFENKVRELMEEFDKDARDVVMIMSAIDPSIQLASTGGGALKRAPRATKTYTNPHTGEVVKTKGGNHKTLKAWRDKYGKETVQSWAK